MSGSTSGVGRDHLVGRGPGNTVGQEPGVVEQDDDDAQGHVYKQPTDPRHADSTGSPFPRAAQEQDEA
jgi:hypothetical protein